MSYRDLMIPSLTSAAFLIFLLVANTEAAQIWDDELKRYLTPQEMAREEVLLTIDEAAKLMFPDSHQIRRDVLTLTPEKKALIETRIGWKFPETSFEVFIGESKGKTDGYAIIQNTVGKHKHMTYMVGVDQGGEVFNVELLIYRESRGSEVGTKRFNYQYEGRDLSDPIRINRDIINISGATMSVRSMSAGVKRVLVLVDEFYLKPLGLGHKANQANGEHQGFWTAIFGN